MTKVQLGESVTFTCSFSDLDYSSTRVKWYKQNSGDKLKLITSLMKVTEKPTFEQGFPSSRFHATVTTTMSTLTIRKTIQEDEAIYHCGVTAWSTDQWSGTYLSLKGNTCSSNANLETFGWIGKLICHWNTHLLLFLMLIYYFIKLFFFLQSPLLVLCWSNFIIGRKKLKRWITV